MSPISPEFSHAFPKRFSNRPRDLCPGPHRPGCILRAELGGHGLRNLGIGAYSSGVRPIDQWEFQDPNLEVHTIYKAYVREYPNKIWSYMVEYLHFRILKFPLN